MKRRSPSNVFTLPKWMIGLKAYQPSGNRTPDIVASSLELNLLWHNRCPSKLRDAIKHQIPLVPLKNQKVLQAFLDMKDPAMLKAVESFISKANAMVDQITQEEPDDQREEQPTESSRESITYAGYSCMDDGHIRSKHSSRGNRAVCAAKRQQADA